MRKNGVFGQTLYTYETLEEFGSNRKEQIKNYLQFIEEGLIKDLDTPLKKAVVQSVLGSETFVREIRRMLKTGKKYDVSANAVVRKHSPQTIENILEVVSQEYNIDQEKILRKSRDQCVIEMRLIVFYLASKYCVETMTLNQIAGIMGCKNGWSVTKAVNRIEKLKKIDKSLIEKLEQLENELVGGQAPINSL